LAGICRSLTVEEERSRGLFIDYGKSLKITFAELMIRYLDDELGIKAGGQSLKGREVYTYIVEAMLRASGERGRQMLADRHARLDARGLWHPGGRAKSERSGNELEWIHRSFAQITVTDIEDWIEERLECVEPATVDRELDEISKIFRLAIRTWGYPLAANPMDGVRRPRYFNERNRRLRDDEEDRLLAAARDEDRRDAIESATRAGAAERLHETDLDALHPSSRKRRVLNARQCAREHVASRELAPTPVLEALIGFFLMTAARRSEALSLRWSNVDLRAKTAFLPETKHGRSRTLSLRRDLIALLERLPRDGDTVFPVTAHRLRRAWERICERAEITDLRIHDLRHEAISRVAELSEYSQFTLVDLQAFSGHRDLRMLLRYAHLCAGQFAQRLDEAFAAKAAHKGRRRLAESDSVKLADVASRSASEIPVDPTCPLLAWPETCDTRGSRPSLEATDRPQGPPSEPSAAVVTGDERPPFDAGQCYDVGSGSADTVQSGPASSSNNVVELDTFRLHRRMSAGIA